MCAEARAVNIDCFSDVAASDKPLDTRLRAPGISWISTRTGPSWSQERPSQRLKICLIYHRLKKRCFNTLEQGESGTVYSRRPLWTERMKLAALVSLNLLLTVKMCIQLQYAGFIIKNLLEWSVCTQWQHWKGAADFRVVLLGPRAYHYVVSVWFWDGFLDSLTAVDDTLCDFNKLQIEIHL